MVPKPIVGFLVSPLAVPLVIALYMFWNGSSNLPLASLLVTAAFSYFVMLVAGLPIHFALKAIKFEAWWLYTLCGALLGALISWYGGIELSSPGFALLPVAASLTAIVWWVLACPHPNPTFKWDSPRSGRAP